MKDIKAETQNEKEGLSAESATELLEDLFCIDILFQIQSRVQNDEIKSYLTWFYKRTLPTLLFELTDALEKKGIATRDMIFKQDVYQKIKKERQFAQKENIILSGKTDSIVKEMGLDFKKRIFDLNILVNDETVLGFNFEDYFERVTDINFWNSLCDAVHHILHIIVSLPIINLDIREMYQAIDSNLCKIASNFDEVLNCKRYSYSCYTLFSKHNDLTTEDKVFILYRYRMLNSMLIMDKLIPDIQIDLGGLTIRSKHFLTKYKASVICTVGSEIQALPSAFGEKMKKEIEKEIDKRFFSLNRKIRGNLHYSFTNNLTIEENRLVEKYQNIYIEIILKIFLDCLNIEIDDETKKMTNFFEECRCKKIAKEELNKHYLWYYLKYSLFKHL